MRARWRSTARHCSCAARHDPARADLRSPWSQGRRRGSISGSSAMIVSCSAPTDRTLSPRRTHASRASSSDAGSASSRCPGPPRQGSAASSCWAARRRAPGSSLTSRVSSWRPEARPVPGRMMSFAGGGPGARQRHHTSRPKHARQVGRSQKIRIGKRNALIYIGQLEQPAASTVCQAYCLWRGVGP